MHRIEQNGCEARKPIRQLDQTQQSAQVFLLLPTVLPKLVPLPIRHGNNWNIIEGIHLSAFQNCAPHWLSTNKVRWSVHFNACFLSVRFDKRIQAVAAQCDDFFFWTWANGRQLRNDIMLIF